MSEPPASGETRPRCLSCSEPHDDDQQYCLECGSRLPAAPRHRADTPLWAWAAVVALAVVAIVSGVVVALLASASDGDLARAADPAPPVAEPAPAVEPPFVPEPGSAPIEPPVTVPLEPADPEPASPLAPAPLEPPLPGETLEPPLSGEDLFPAEPSEPPNSGEPIGPPDPPGLLDPTAPDPPGLLDPSEPEPPPPAPPPSPPTPPGSPEEWPAGTDGYTVILASIPESRGRAEADVRAARARNAGLDEVGVLFSSSFGSLRAGYWVTFTGVHDTLNAARTELGAARAAGFPSAYTRRVAG